MEINKEKTFVSVVAYLRNDLEHLPGFLETVFELFEANFDKYEIIFVNDHSTDGSLAIIDDFASKHHVSVAIVNMSYYQGLESSMKAGVDLAIGDFVYEFDTIEIDYNPQIIIDIYHEALKDIDNVRARAMSKKKASSHLFYRLFNRYSNTKGKLTSETFRIISRRAINRVDSLFSTVPYRKAALASCGLKTKIVDYSPIKKIRTTMKGRKYRFKTGFNSLILFSDIFYRFSIFMSLFMMISTIGVGIYVIVMFLNNVPIAGWTSSMLFQSAAFFGIFILFAVLTKYLSLILELSFKKQDYLVESIKKINK